MKKIITLLAIAIFIFGCNGDKQNNASGTTDSKDTLQFFQIADYINKQIDDVKKTPYFIYKKSETNGAIDSTAINNEIFLTLSNTFLKPDITNLPLKKAYNENIFYDETTKTISITYSTTDKTLEVQNANIILAEDGKTVKRIFIRKFFDYADSSAIEQLGWKPGESFQINRLVQAPGKEDRTSLTSVIWNEKKK